MSPHDKGSLQQEVATVFFILDNVKESLADEDTYPLCRAQTSESGWVRNCTCLTLTALASVGKDSLPASLQNPSQGGSKSTGVTLLILCHSVLSVQQGSWGGAPQWRPWANSTMSELHGPSVPSPHRGLNFLTASTGKKSLLVTHHTSSATEGSHPPC